MKFYTIGYKLMSSKNYVFECLFFRHTAAAKDKTNQLTYTPSRYNIQIIADNILLINIPHL